MNKLIIGIVLPYLKSRGTENQALRLTTGFIARGADVVLFVVQGWGQDSMYCAFQNAGARVVNVGTALHKGQKKLSMHRVFRLSWLMQKYHCDVVISRAGMANKITGYAGFFARKRTVGVLSSAIGYRESGRSFGRALKRFKSANNIGFCDRIVSVSNEGANRFKARYPYLAEKVIAIPNGIDVLPNVAMDQDFELDPGNFKFCFSGSLEINRKGLDVLIGALGLLLQEYEGCENVSLVIIGTGEEEASLKELIKSQGIDNHVIFAGEQPEPYALMLGCQGFVLPSRREGFPNALLEAMALGMCAIAADCDTGPREIITHGVDGLLVPPDDHKSLATAMARVMQNKTLREGLGSRARTTIRDNFSFDKMCNQYFQVLTDKLE